MTDDLKAREAAALADFRDYIHVNYPPECILVDPQWHAPKLFRAAVGSWLAAMPVPQTPNVSTLMMQLEDAVDACADQPLHVDRMTLTRTWRGILEAAFSDRVAAPHTASRKGTVERIGGVTAQCPECWSSKYGMVSTSGLVGDQIPDGLLFTGVPCNVCGRTFTIELTDVRPEQARGCATKVIP